MIWWRTPDSGSFPRVVRGIIERSRASRRRRACKARASSTEVDCPCNGKPH